MGRGGRGFRNHAASRSYCLYRVEGAMNDRPVFLLVKICWLFFLVIGASRSVYLISAICIPLILDKAIAIYAVQSIEYMTHAQTLFARLPDAILVVRSAADAIRILIWVGTL